MKYCQDMTLDEYIDCYLEGDLPNKEMVKFEFKLLDDEVLASAYEKALEARKIARKAFEKWCSATGFIPLRVYIDDRFDREIKVNDDVFIMLQEGQSCRVEDSQGNEIKFRDSKGNEIANVIPFEKEVEPPAPLPSKRAGIIKSKKYEPTTKEYVIFVEGKEIRVKFIIK